MEFYLGNHLIFIKKIKTIYNMNKKILILSFAIIFGTLNAFAQMTSQPATKIKKIAVSGSAEMDVEPDEIYVNFELKEYYTKQRSKIGIETIKKEFLESCAKAGIAKEDIRVQNMGGNAYDYWFVRKRKPDPDFLATVTYIVKFSSADKIDLLVPKLNDDATSNMYMSKISNSKMEEFRKQVKIKAMQAAKTKALYLTESIGEKLGGALLIEETDASQPQPMMYKAMMSNMEMASDGGAPEPSTQFQKINVRYEIRAEFELQ